jgi:uncharacterized membrane protein YcaP (DUF421 family)
MTRIIIITLVALLFLACQKKKPSDVSIENDILKGKNILIADTIIYDVVIKNPSPDNAWEEERLRHFKHDVFIDQVFNNIYRNKYLIKSYQTGDEISSRTIKRMEKSGDINRNAIGKIQFTEKWLWDKSNDKLEKETISIVLGQEVKEKDGTLRGYKPVFKVIF